MRKTEKHRKIPLPTQKFNKKCNASKWVFLKHKRHQEINERFLNQRIRAYYEFKSRGIWMSFGIFSKKIFTKVWLLSSKLVPKFTAIALHKPLKTSHNFTEATVAL